LFVLISVASIFGIRAQNQLFSQTIDDLLQRKKNPIEMSLVCAAHLKIQEGSILFGLWRRKKDELSYVWFKKIRK
jgi:hypothetical protein